MSFNCLLSKLGKKYIIYLLLIGAILDKSNLGFLKIAPLVSYGWIIKSKEILSQFEAPKTQHRTKLSYFIPTLSKTNSHPYLHKKSYKMSQVEITDTTRLNLKTEPPMKHEIYPDTHYEPKNDPLDLEVKVPKKILIMVEPSPFTWISGYATRYKELLKFLSGNKNTVLILTTDTTSHRPSRAFGFPIIYTNGFRIPFYNKDGYTLTADFPQFKGWDIIRNFSPEILHVTSPGFLCLTSTFLYSKIFRIPLVIAYHTHLPAYAPKYLRHVPFITTIAWLLVKWVHRHADLTLVTSPELKQELESQGIERISLWRKGIDTKRFSPTYRNHSMRIKLSGGFPNSTVLLNVGRLGPEKDLHVLKEVIEKLPNARLALVGSGPLENSLKKLFDGTNTTFLGSLEGEELSQAYASCDIFCMPSTTETLGFVVLEAMASGTPVIASRAGGLPNLVKEGKTGYLVDPLNVDQFVQKIEFLMNSPETSKSMGSTARAEAENWNWNDTMHHLQTNQYRLAIQNFRKRRFNDSLIFKILRFFFARHIKKKS